MKRVNFVLLLSFIWVRFGVQVGAGVRVMVRDRAVSYTHLTLPTKA